MKAKRSGKVGKAPRRRSRRRGRAREYEDRRVRWASLARSLGGRFVQAEKSNFDAMFVPHRDWRIKVDTYLASNGNQAVPYTRVRAFFVAQDRFRFRMVPANPWTRLMDRIGFRDVRVGDPRIDRRFVIKGRDTGRLRSFFLDSRLRAVLGDRRECRLEVMDLPWRERRLWGPGVRQVFVRTKGEFVESARLKGLIQLCEATLDRLASSGSASIRPPEMPVKSSGSPRGRRPRSP